MPRYDFRTPRLYVEVPLAARASVALDRDQVNYLANVLRLNAGHPVLLFNGHDGEWRARLMAAGKRNFTADVEEQSREQSAGSDLHLLFAPLKHARLDYLVQKAVEMGTSRLQPVITRHTQVARVNVERMRANVIEAAQQCGILTLAEVAEPMTFDSAIAGLDAGRILIFCDEDADIKNPIEGLRMAGAGAPPALAVLIGPEGGFAEEERKVLERRPNVLPISLGPRILRPIRQRWPRWPWYRPFLGIGAVGHFANLKHYTSNATKNCAKLNRQLRGASSMSFLSYVLKTTSLAILAAFCVLTPAHGANWLEKTVYMSGTNYTGVLPACEVGLGKIATRFAQKESRFWNSNLQILGFEKVREIAYNPWALDTIPRRFCRAVAAVSDGRKHAVYYSIGEDTGMIGMTWGVDWCVVGLDRNWAFNPACKMAQP